MAVTLLYRCVKVAGRNTDEANIQRVEIVHNSQKTVLLLDVQRET